MYKYIVGVFVRDLGTRSTNAKQNGWFFEWRVPRKLKPELSTFAAGPSRLVRCESGVNELFAEAPVFNITDAYFEVPA